MRTRTDLFTEKQIELLMGNIEEIYLFQQSFFQLLKLSINEQNLHESLIGKCFLLYVRLTEDKFRFDKTKNVFRLFLERRIQEIFRLLHKSSVVVSRTEQTREQQRLQKFLRGKTKFREKKIRSICFVVFFSTRKDLSFTSEHDRTETRRFSSFSNSTDLSISVTTQRTAEIHQQQSQRFRKYSTSAQRYARRRVFYQRTKATNGIRRSYSQVANDRRSVAGLFENKVLRRESKNDQIEYSTWNFSSREKI